MRRVVNHAKSEGLKGGPSRARRDVRDAWLAGLRVNGHGDKSIDQRQCIGTGLLSDVCHLRNAGYVGGELDDQRISRHALRRGHDLIEQAWIAAELNSSMRGVGTGNIQLVSGDSLSFVENLNGAFIVLTGIAKHVGED